ncbi:MAG: hypothetical protein ACRD19_16530 [Terriglobia bacterium]
MAAPYHVYTIERAAKMLGVSVDLQEELAMTMTPEEGSLWLHDHTEDGCRAFADFGINNAAEQLSDPIIVAHLQSLIQT